MSTPDEKVELFRAYTADEMQEKEAALATPFLFRGLFSSGPID